MRRLTWWIQRLVSRLGWPGVGGAVLLLVCAGLHWGLVAREVAREDGLRAFASARASILKSREERPAVPDKADLMARFYRSLPPSATEQRTDVLARMQAAALAEGLVLEQASYQWNASVGETFDGLDIVLPVKGNYLQLRRFIAHALADNPALALEATSFDRRTVSDAAVDAQLRFTLYLQKP